MDELDMYRLLNKLFVKLCKENNITQDECRKMRNMIPFIVGDLSVLQLTRRHSIDKEQVILYGETQFREMLAGVWKPAFAER